MQVLISDANVLIDMEVGGLLGAMFRLPYTFKVADLLYHDELSRQHAHLLELGLQLAELSSETMVDAYRMTQAYADPSRYDCFSMALAKQEACPLLTGDKALRRAAEREAVVVKGTIWLVEQMVTHKVVSKDAAEEAYQQMKEQGSRLPWSTAFRRLDDI